MITEQQQKVLDMVDSGLSITETARRLGRARSTISETVKRARRNLSKPQINKCSEFGIPTEQLHSGWVKDEGASYYFQVPKHDEKHEEYVDAIRDALSGTVGLAKATTPPVVVSDLLTRYVIADLHLGMMSWGAQTGQDYDLKIGTKHLEDAIDALMLATPNADTALILNVGDTFHANDQKNMTPMSGHILDMDGRFPKIARVTVKAIIRVIDRALEKHKRVEYVGIQGNHDPDQSHWLNIALDLHYENHPRVKVHWNPSKWFSMVWGKNHITAHHGDQVKFDRMALYLSDVYSVERGQTYWWYCDTGHVHHEQERDIGGCKFRSYRTLAPKDAFAASHGFSSRQTMTAITVHKERGEIAEHHFNIYPRKPRHESN